MPVYLMMAYTNISLYVPVAMMGIAFSLVPAVMWPAVAYIVDQSRLGTAYALMTLIQQIGFFAMNLLIGKANDYSHAGPEQPGRIRAGNVDFLNFGLRRPDVRDFVADTGNWSRQSRVRNNYDENIVLIIKSGGKRAVKTAWDGPSSETEVTSDAGGWQVPGDMRLGILPMAGGSAKFRVQPRKPYNVKIFISHPSLMRPGKAT